MAPRPKNVIICNTIYAVAPLPAGSELDGQYHAATQTIEVRPGLPADYDRYILAHEIVHGILEHAGAVPEGGETFTEEQVACIIGRALPMLIRGNPTLVEYLKGG